jgi:hypothetical protein
VKSALAIAVVGAVLATGAAAETTRIWSPNESASVTEGPLDVEARWVRLEDGGYEVTATFIGRTADAEQRRLVMRLDEGDDVTISIPGHRSVAYRFARDRASAWPMRVQLTTGVALTVVETGTRMAALTAR